MLLDCSATQSKRLASLAASNSAQETDDDPAAAEASQAALDVDIKQLQVRSVCNVTFQDDCSLPMIKKQHPDRCITSCLTATFTAGHGLQQKQG